MIIDGFRDVTLHQGEGREFELDPGGNEML